MPRATYQKSQVPGNSPARGSSSSLLVEGSGSSKIPRESAPEMATAESLVEELSEDAGGELKRVIFKFLSVLCFPYNDYAYNTPFLQKLS